MVSSWRESGSFQENILQIYLEEVQTTSIIKQTVGLIPGLLKSREILPMKQDWVQTNKETIRHLVQVFTHCVHMYLYYSFSCFN